MHTRQLFMHTRQLLLTAVVLAGCRDAVEPKRGTLSADLGPPTQYQIVDLGSLGGDTSEARAINARSQVVGFSQTSSGAKHAFVWEKGVISDLGTLGGDYSNAVAINNRGDIAGVSTDASGSMRAVLWRNGLIQDLGPVSFLDLVPRGQRCVCLSETGLVAWATPPPGRYRAMLWDGSQAIDLGTLGGDGASPNAVNSRGQVVGASNTPTGSAHAFVWENGVMRDLGAFGGFGSSAADINEQGVITGTTWRDDPRTFHAFIWNGQMTDLGALPGDGASAGAILNERGQIAGISYMTYFADPKHAFIWDDRGMQALNPPNLTTDNERVVGLNNRGQVIGLNIQGGGLFRRHLWVWEDGVLQELPTFGGDPNVVSIHGVAAINDRGDIVGWSTAPGRRVHAVLWRQGSDSH